jgi:hypothetical protein
LHKKFVSVVSQLGLDSEFMWHWFAWLENMEP